MTNTLLLESMINESGIKKSKIAKTLGISYPSLRRKIRNETSFTPEEIQALCDLLNITSLEMKEAIFFNRNVEKKETKESVR